MRILTGLFLFIVVVAQAQAKRLSNEDIATLRANVANAHKTYLTGSPASRQDAMLSLSKQLEALDSRTMKQVLGPNTLAVTYVRLGILAKENHDNVQAKHYFDQGLKHYKSQRTISLERLVELTYTLDNMAREYATP